MTEKFISNLISSQFGEEYHSTGKNFIAFIEAYYEWLEQEGNVTHETRSLLDYNDIDRTKEEFVIYFKNQYINSLPENVLSNKKFLIKHILDLYRTKGTERACKLLFRMLFNEDIEIYIPNKDIFRLSAAKWYVPSYIEVSDHPDLKNLVGYQIYNSSKTATAVVENYLQKTVNNKIINVLYLSSLQGKFKFKEQILCTNFPSITNKNAPLVLGSLSTVSIVNGGTNWNVGDIVSVRGKGAEGKARIAATTNQNGKVLFTLVDGGFGFSVNAAITVTGGNGTGASFKVGGITNKEIYQINTDIINDYYNTQLDISSEGFNLNVSNTTGNFSVGEIVTSSANTIELDVTVTGLAVANGESLSNSSLGISNLIAYNSQENFIQITGPETQLNNANLNHGTILVSNTSNSQILINTKFNKTTTTGTATVITSNSTIAYVNNANGYFVPYTTVTGLTSGKTAYINRTDRLTDWLFSNPSGQGFKSNLDTPLSLLYNTYNLEVGTISFLKDVNPGIGYSANPDITIIEPNIYALNIPDGRGRLKGFDATVTGIAGTAKGIATAVEIFDSGYGYEPDEYLFLDNPKNFTSINGNAIIDLNGVVQGYYKNNVGFLSNSNYIQDSYYYQAFSYEILSENLLPVYEKLVRNLIHPSGIALFGKYSLKRFVSTNTSLVGNLSIREIA